MFLKSQKNFGPQRAWKTLALLVAALFGILTFGFQRAEFHPQSKIEALLNSQRGLVLENWKYEILSCKSPEEENCTSVGEGSLRFPQTQSLRQSKSSPVPNRAKVTYELSESEKEWLGTKANVAIVLSKSVQKNVQMRGVPGIQAGLGSNSSFFLKGSELSEMGQIELTFDFPKLPFFGPLDVSPLLVEADASGEAQSLSANLGALSGFSRQLTVIVSLFAIMLSLVLDTSVIFLHLGALSLLFMSRSFLWTLVENGQLEANVLTYTVAILLTSLFCLSLLTTTYVMTSRKPLKISPKRLTLASVVVIVISILSGYSSLYRSLNLDELFEGIAAVTALIILGKNWKENANNSEQSETRKLGILDHKTFKVKKILLFVLISIYATANLSDFWRVTQGEVKSVGHWAHALFQPFLICLGLIQVGLVSRQIKEAAELMFEKARQDKEIEEGRSYQLSMLPSLRRQTKHFEWRAWYKPASRLAGDWLDVRELEFLGGEKFLAAVVCDVTGHGTGSALTTSVLSSHWSIWCEELRYVQAPETASERGELVAQALSRLDKGIASGQVHGMATAVCILVDAARKQGSLCSCAHPPVCKFSQTAIDLIRSKGNGFVGEPHTRTGFEVSTFDFAPGEILCLYTDGLFFEKGKSPSGFVRLLRQNLEKTPLNISAQFLKQMRRARSFNRENRDYEDDITLMFVSYAKQNDSTATVRSAS